MTPEVSPSTGDPTSVQLGGETYKLEPQRIGRLGKRIPEILTISQISSGDVDLMDIGIGERLHGALKVFIPDLAPVYKLAGYGSQSDYDAVQAHAAEVRAAAEAHTEEVRRRREEFLKARAAADGVEVGELQARVLDEFEAPEFTPPAFDDPYDAARDESPTPPEIMDAIDAILKVHGGDRVMRLLKSIGLAELLARLIRVQLTRWAQSVTERSQTGGQPRSTTSTTTAPTPAPSESVPTPTATEPPSTPAAEPQPASAA